MPSKMFQDTTNFLQPFRQDFKSLTSFLTLPHITLIALLSLCGFFIYQYFLHPLSKYPGPLEARLGLDTWLMRRAITLDMGPKLRSLHDRYVCTLSCWLGSVVTDARLCK